MPFRIKDIYRDTIVGFNNSGKPLGQRDDLHLLYESAKRNKSLLKYFDEIATDEEVEDAKDKEALKNPKFAQNLKIDEEESEAEAKPESEPEFESESNKEESTKWGFWKNR